MAFDLSYLAAVLKFSAVPAGAFELLRDERKNAIDSWLVGTLPSLIKGFAASLVALYTCVVLLVEAGPYLLFVGIVFIFILSAAAVADQKHGQDLIYILLFIRMVLGTLIMGLAFIEWILPDSFILAISYPFECFSVWANKHEYVGWMLPNYSSTRFLDDFRNVFDAIEDWLWDWLAILNGFYFFGARGVLLLMVILIQGFFLASIAIGVLLGLCIPVHLFMRFADFIKRTMQITKSRIPVAAFVLWASGETLDFVLRTLEELKAGD